MRVLADRRVRALIAFALAAVVVAACFSSTTRARQLGGTAYQVETPVKAHLRDGSIVVFRSGVLVANDTARGPGMRYSANLRDSLGISAVPLDSVVGIETFVREINPGRTVIYTSLLTPVAVVGTAALAVVVFGSCPTLYVDSAGVPALQAESFSYSIAPLLEKRDVDRLRVAPDSSGIVTLELRNEAMETHYIDHLELLEVRHRPGEYAAPASRGPPVVVGSVRAFSTARDRSGRDVGRLVAAEDLAVFATADEVLARAAAGDEVEDYIDLVMPREPGKDSVALLLRARASLLTSTLLYQYMIERPGARSLDWMARDLGRITTVAQLAHWYVNNFALRVSVMQGGAFRQVARLADFGPVAWRDIATVVPAGDGDSVRVRLTFLSDVIRFDRIAVSADWRRADARAVPVARVIASGGGERTDVAGALRRADDRRLETHPGDRLYLLFDVGDARLGEARTFFAAAQGYYTEWVRGSWAKSPRDSMSFSPSRVRIPEVLESWRAARDSLEQHFYATRVPIV